MGCGRGQGRFRTICKFTMRNMNEINIDSYVIKVAHIDYDKDV